MRQTPLRRFTIDKIASLYEEVSNHSIAKYRREKLNNTDFTIISNNCWGGHVYRRYGIPYLSPTVGMYFFSEEYIRFLDNIETNIHLPFEVVSVEESKYSDILIAKGQRDVLVGKLGNEIEVVLLHYKDKKEAYEKWNRRVERVNLNNLIVKMSEMNVCSEEHLSAFDKMSFEKKILLVSKEHKDISSQIVVNRYLRDGEISNDTIYYDRYLDLTKLINS